MLSYPIFLSRDNIVGEKKKSLKQHETDCATLFFQEHLKTLAPKTLTYFGLDSLIQAELANKND